MSTTLTHTEPPRGFRSRWRDRLLCEWWSIGICDRSIGEVLERGALGPVRWLEPARGAAYRADPFVWPGTGLVLCEEVPLTTGIGHIVALRETDGRFTPVRTLLNDGGHRSYPFVFQYDGETYLLPESAACGPTVLYRLDRGWNLERVATIAPDRRLVDATMFEADARLWIAATDLAYGTDNNLCIYYADQPAGPWHPHGMNPVVTGRRTARSGGTPFRHRDGLYRPAQDCTETYGGALVITEITTLTPDAFAERIVCRIAPDTGGTFPHGLHTISADGDRCLVDGKRLVFDPRVVAGKINRRLFARPRTLRLTS
ncbi:MULTISPECIES: glucosamine inositolphosphorylceramide transferase family protein [Acidiphilium]|uniref:Glucosamine inositolphosphorylceramide transferase 1 N-terminal domain-containing protein n=1 Tax=Acidiphilium rubrum TaxID=526 RepID=A0A8G2CLA6_ACIRU|nr:MULTISPECIES: hypothetical protein [Acidiphilium]SIQ96556.1 hypothetical protein SAMN05421828_112112 [Acidiphilium rubrum]